ncbi:MAG TPA: hypothetical protein ENN54_04540 [Thermoplasmatales archaeon]|nr:molybdopterin-guanine dinucleotide biosynthesis protein MobB [Candidatus Thermoplasmatota archaeon]MDD5779433.1 molybdopterin-guanine dinucleotide biosynthesis protein MobB [Candidatus Thermoplasmatota archaeon]HDS59543.1 hypothetical protein [Thermoplasmatales archaeon]
MLVAISGFSGSGKTSLLESLIARLSPEYRLLIVKDTHEERIDGPDTDTRRHRRAGAQASAITAGQETALFWEGRLEVERLAELTAAQVVLLEGFKNSSYPKIWLGAGEGPHVVLRNPPVEAAERYIREQVTAENLPGLDCGDCGHPTCAALAEAVVAGEASLDDCVVPVQPEVEVMVDGRHVPLKPFVQEFIAGAVRGMLSALHGVEDGGERRIRIEVRPRSSDMF